MLFYGAGSGMGKSTLSSRAAAALERSGIRARYLREEAVLDLDVFAAYVAAVGRGEGADSALLLEACTGLVRQCRESGETWVLDSLLPCSDWLASSGCPRDEIERFFLTLLGRIDDLDPVLIFLDGDVSVALARAIEARGADWARALARKRCEDDDPQALIAYFSGMQEVGRALLPAWPFERLVLDPTSADREACEAAVLRSLGLGDAA